MRTALWQFVGADIALELRDDLARLKRREAETRKTLEPFLSRGEITAMMQRIERFVEMGTVSTAQPAPQHPVWVVVISRATILVGAIRESPSSSPRRFDTDADAHCVRSSTCGR